MSDPPRYEVNIDEAAEADLRDIVDYLHSRGADAAARNIVRKILDRITALGILPDAGSVPKELEGAEARGFRQFVSRPYRVVYQVQDRRVVVVLIADGRRDMRTLLTERLLAS